jgi:hypothetical protein
MFIREWLHAGVAMTPGISRVATTKKSNECSLPHGAPARPDFGAEAAMLSSKCPGPPGGEMPPVTGPEQKLSGGKPYMGAPLGLYIRA